MKSGSQADRVLLDDVLECIGYIDRMHWTGNRVLVDGIDHLSCGNNIVSTKSRGEITEKSDGGFSRRRGSPVTSWLCGWLASRAHRWASPGSGASPLSEGSRHTALAVKSSSSWSISSSVRSCCRARRGRRNTDEYSSSRASDMRYGMSPPSMASSNRAGGLSESAAITLETMTFVSTIQTFDAIGSSLRLRRRMAAGAEQRHSPLRKRLVSSTASAIASSVPRPDFARPFAAISLADPKGWMPFISGLSSMMESMEHFCCAATSSIRCVRSSGLVVRRAMMPYLDSQAPARRRPHHSIKAPDRQSVFQAGSDS